jgi:MFS family permease
LTQGVVVGLAGGFLFVPSLAVVQPYFSKNLGLAVGIVATGSSVGAVVYPVIFTNLIHRVGFGWTVRVIGFVALATLGFPLVLSKMRGRPPVVRKFFTLSIFTDWPFLICILACWLGYAGNYVAFFYTSFFGISKGWMSESLGYYLVPILNAGSALGRVFPNWLADHVGPINVVIPGTYGVPPGVIFAELASLIGALSIGIVLTCNSAVHNAAGVIVTTGMQATLSLRELANRR